MPESHRSSMVYPKDIVADACTNDDCGVLIEMNYMNKDGVRIGQERVDGCPLCGEPTRPVTREEYDEWTADDDA